MMASVFFMQPLGQTAGNLVSLIVIAAAQGSGSDNVTRTMDSAWRWVFGIGVVPGAIAIILRFAIPESPRYLVEIEDDPVTAEFDATTLFTESSTSPTIGSASFTTGISNGIQLPPISSITSHSVHEDEDHSPRLPPASLNTPWRLARTDIMRYFWTEGNWRTLAGTSLTWLLLDFGFYGIGLSTPQFLAKTWGELHIETAQPTWMTDSRPGASVYGMFFDTSVRGLIVLNIGSLVGGLLLILFAYRINRVTLQKCMFLALAALFITVGCMFTTLTTSPPAIVTLYAIGQIIFNFGTLLPSPLVSPCNETSQLTPTGPNGTTYMIPAEIFPTRYRGTCHGLSAGAGKLGSILVEIFSCYYHFGAGPGSETTHHHGIVLFVFSACMVLGSAITHFWIPSVQQRNSHSRIWAGEPYTLETLALGRMGRKSRDKNLRKTTSRQRVMSFSEYD